MSKANGDKSNSLWRQAGVAPTYLRAARGRLHPEKRRRVTRLIIHFDKNWSVWRRDRYDMRRIRRFSRLELYLPLPTASVIGTAIDDGPAVTDVRNPKHCGQLVVLHALPRQRNRVLAIDAWPEIAATVLGGVVHICRLGPELAKARWLHCSMIRQACQLRNI